MDGGFGFASDSTASTIQCNYLRRLLLSMYNWIFLLIFSYLLAACSGGVTIQKSKTTASPYVDLLKEARSVESAVDSAQRSREDLVNE